MWLSTSKFDASSRILKDVYKQSKWKNVSRCLRIIRGIENLNINIRLLKKFIWILYVEWLTIEENSQKSFKYSTLCENWYKTLISIDEEISIIKKSYLSPACGWQCQRIKFLLVICLFYILERLHKKFSNFSKSPFL